LLGRKPVPESNTDSSHAFHPADPRRQLGAQKTGVARLVRDASNRGEPKVDRGRRIAPLLKVNPVAQHDGAVEREPRL
jgi:hypothetical protein